MLRDYTHYEVQKLMIQSNPTISNSGYHIQSKDVSLLADDMITAEKMLYLNNEMVCFDITSKQPIYYKHGGNNNRND